jgi:hypothetical protein
MSRIVSISLLAALLLSGIALADRPLLLPGKTSIYQRIFVIDSTISMQPYIQETRSAVRRIYERMRKAGVLDWASFGLVAFRAHSSDPKRDSALEYVAKEFAELDQRPRLHGPDQAHPGGARAADEEPVERPADDPSKDRTRRRGRDAEAGLLFQQPALDREPVRPRPGPGDPPRGDPALGSGPALWDLALHALCTGLAGHGKHNMLWC